MRMNLAVMDWVSVVHVMAVNIMTTSFRMKTHNGHQQVMVNTLMFADRTIIALTMY